MCGITGFVDFNKKTKKSVLEKASLKLNHRGTDSSGCYYDGKDGFNLGLASRRLAIIDISANANQPFISRCGNFAIVFNGTIYNYKELRKTLELSNFEFRSQSDTEVFLAAYISWNLDFLRRVNGVFSVCIYDKIKNKLIIARDNVGVKPLFYSFDQHLFTFGSELSACRTYSDDNKINKNALAFYLKYGYFPTHASIFSHIGKVKPGELLELDLHSQKLISQKYWSIPSQSVDLESSNEEDVIKKCHRLLIDSVLSRIIADAPVGVLVSGGIDSSLTAAIVQKNVPNSIQTFTIGFEDRNIDESVSAKKIAQHLNSNHHEYILTAQEAIKTIKNLGRIYDEPMGDSGAIALYAASKFASEKVKVLLSSEGGDELFAGYRSYVFSQKWFPIFRRLPSFKFLKHIHPKIPDLLAAKNTLEFFNTYNAFFTNDEILKLLRTNHPKRIANVKKRDTLNTLLAFDLENYLPEDLLMKADRTCMYWGVENRDPFLDKHLVSYAMQIPGNQKLKNGVTKHILKQIAYKYIPEHLLDRPKKGFSIPLSNWLHNHLKQFIVLHLQDFSLGGLLDQNEVNHIVKCFVAKKRGYDRKIWLLLSLKLWADEHFVKEKI